MSRWLHVTDYALPTVTVNKINKNNNNKNGGQGRPQCTILKLMFYFIFHFPDSNLKLTLRPATNLVDDSFTFIVRDGDDSPKIYADSAKLAEQYAGCFYQGENSAFDLCDGGIVSFFIFLFTFVT